MAEDDPVVQWLLEGDPAIRWQALRDLLNASETEVTAERARVGTRAGVLGCWRCRLRMASGRAGPMFRVPRSSQRPLPSSGCR